MWKTSGRATGALSGSGNAPGEGVRGGDEAGNGHMDGRTGSLSDLPTQSAKRLESSGDRAVEPRQDHTGKLGRTRGAQ